jgi:hypothetical protein
MGLAGMVRRWCGVLVSGVALACSSNSASPKGGAGGADGGPCVPAQPTPPAQGTGCDGVPLYQLPEDPAAQGPWPVGVRTADIDGLVTEVWYPAKLGSEQCQPKVEYDIRKHLPDSEQGKIPDSANPWQVCDCYRGLPIDEQHGPYPVVLFIHGLAGFRTLSLTQQVHWASRGFVVLAADHPGITLEDVLATLNGQGSGVQADQVGDANKILDAVEAPSGDLAFLSGHLDTNHMAVGGHSAGGGAVEKLEDRPGLLVRMPMSAGGTTASPSLVSTLILGGMDDGIVAYSKLQSAYDTTPVKKRLVGVSNAGHGLPTDLCSLGRDQGGILQVGIKYGVQIPSLVATLASDGCGAKQIDPAVGTALVEFASSAVLEETLMCRSGATAALSAIQQKYPQVGEYREDTGPE